MGETKAKVIRTDGFLKKFNAVGTWGPGVYTDERIHGTMIKYADCGDTIHFFLCAAFEFNDWDVKYPKSQGINYTTNERILTSSRYQEACCDADFFYVNISDDKTKLTFPVYPNMSHRQSISCGRRWYLCNPDGIIPLYEGNIDKKKFFRDCQKHWNKPNILKMCNEQSGGVEIFREALAIYEDGCRKAKAV